MSNIPPAAWNRIDDGYEGLSTVANLAPTNDAGEPQGCIPVCLTAPNVEAMRVAWTRLGMKKPLDESRLFPARISKPPPRPPAATNDGGTPP